MISALKLTLLIAHKSRILIIHSFLWSVFFASPLLLGWISQQLIQSAEKSDGKWVAIFLILFLLIFFVRAVVVVIADVLEFELGFFVSSYLKSRIFQRLANTTNLIENAGEWISKIRDDTAVVGQFSCAISTLPLRLIAIAAAIWLMWEINWLATLITLASIILTCIFSNYIIGRIKHHSVKQRKLSGLYASLLHDASQFIEAIRGFKAESRVIFDLESIAEKRGAAAVSQAGYISIIPSLSVMAISLGVGVYLLIEGIIFPLKESIEMGALLSYFFYTSVLSENIGRFGNIVSIAQQADISISRIALSENDLNEEIDSHISNNKQMPDLMCFKIIDRNLDLDVQLQPGQAAIIVGEIGSGKSELLHRVIGYSRSPETTVLWNNVELSSFERSVMIGGRICLVTDESASITETLSENIKFGVNLNEDDVEKLIQLVQLEPDVKKFPEGLKTIVGPRGFRLSRGQQQRLSLARALARKPDVLMLDNALSGLDDATKVKLWRQLRAEFKGVLIMCETLAESGISADYVINIENISMRNKFAI